MDENSNKLTKLNNSVRKRPSMFLPTKEVGQPLRPLFMIHSFLQSMLSLHTILPSRDLRLSIMGEHFVFHANQSLFCLSNLTKEKSVSFDKDPIEWILDQILPLQENNEDYAAFVHMLALVCLSDTCQLDISFDTNKHYRQIFFKGVPVSKRNLWFDHARVPLYPYIRLSLTPSQDIFAVLYEEADQVLNSVDECLNYYERKNLCFERIVYRKMQNEIEIGIFNCER